MNRDKRVASLNPLPCIDHAHRACNSDLLSPQTTFSHTTFLLHTTVKSNHGETNDINSGPSIKEE